VCPNATTTCLPTRCEINRQGHPELAGNGIEYLWGISKKQWRNWLNNPYGSAEDFVKSVRLAMSNCPVPINARFISSRSVKGRELAAPLSDTRVDLCARRARYYRRLFCHYKDAEALHEGVAASGANLTMYAAVEQAYKRSSTHRSALDLCSGFISRILRV
jgi:hypothetical protein